MRAWIGYIRVCDAMMVKSKSKRLADVVVADAEQDVLYYYYYRLCVHIYTHVAKSVLFSLKTHLGVSKLLKTLVFHSYHHTKGNKVGKHMLSSRHRRFVICTFLCV